MKDSRKFHRSVFLLLLCVSIAATGCHKFRPPTAGHGTPPPIVPPAAAKPSLAKVDPSLLPPGAHAQLPAYDGDSFFVSLPVQQVNTLSSSEVRDQVIGPILKAVGFERGMKGLATPPNNGLDQPRGNFKGLAQAVAFEYANHRQLFRPETQEMLDVFLGKTPPTEDINKAIELGEGMNFAQFVAGIERLETQYPFQQVEGNVPIEHTLLIASRWEQQGITSVWGALFNNYTIANNRRLSATDATRLVGRALRVVKGIRRVSSCEPRPEITTAERTATQRGAATGGQKGSVATTPGCRVIDGPYLVLFPYSTDSSGKVLLRYSYRMIVNATWYTQTGPFLVWLDADNAKVIRIDPLIADSVGATGAVYNRDPGVGETTSFFQVDPSSGGQYTLQLSGVLNRVDYQGNGYDSLDVSISDSTNGSSSTFANFNQAPINDASQALCASGTNKAFQQVSFYGTLYRYYQTVLSQGIFIPFPTSPWNPKVESASAGCNAWSSMDYGACQGYFDATCPNYVGPGNPWMNFAHDNTVVGHEFAHSITPRLTNARPADWCGTPPCAIPIGWGTLHDLADFWADHFEQTNCTAGWVAKNTGGSVDHSLNCASTDEDGGLPRDHLVTVPFNPAAANDHFPEHRALGNFGGGYADGQIGAAALWQVNVGMRSKCRPSGWPQFGVRFQRALKNTGFTGFSPSSPATDTDVYRLLYDLEAKMVDQWATSGSPGGPPAFAHNGPHTTNKVTAGFAKTGIFLLPYQCLDGNTTTTDPTSCPTGENGGDSVVDIDDNDASNDITVNGVSMYTHDFLKLGGVPATFQVWTGPRYKLDGTSGASTLNNPSPCNRKFSVEVSTDPSFPVASTIVSPFTNVNINPTNNATPQCFGTWTPSNADWTTLQAGGAGTRIYYRARTRDASNANERLSTLPGAGLWTVPPPYAVFTTDGKSDY
jgi:hypothetical protein